MELKRKQAALKWLLPWIPLPFTGTSRLIMQSVVVFFWLVVVVFFLLEVKRYYDIDVLPGYNSPVDDAYGAARGTLTGLLKKK